MTAINLTYLGAPAGNLATARAASERVALDTLAAENRALTEELAHMQAKLAAAMALADQAVRERDRLEAALTTLILADEDDE